MVEDDALVRDLFADTLRFEGHAVDLAATASEAWVSLEARSYDLVIADWQLPDGDGTVIADAAAELGAETMVMSGYLFRMPGGRADPHETLMKPLRPNEIVAAVERRLGKA